MILFILILGLLVIGGTNGGYYNYFSNIVVISLTLAVSVYYFINKYYFHFMFVFIINILTTATFTAL